MDVGNWRVKGGFQSRLLGAKRRLQPESRRARLVRQGGQARCGPSQSEVKNYSVFCALWRDLDEANFSATGELVLYYLRHDKELNCDIATVVYSSSLGFATCPIDQLRCWYWLDKSSDLCRLAWSCSVGDDSGETFLGND